ncbi:MAG: DegT/DnrJ/EryC1/StrS family aminotransferase [Cytophagales bacterium]
MEQMIVPFYSLEQTNAQIHQEIKDVFERLYLSSHFILGKELHQFEINFSRFLDTKYALGVGSGLDALVIALKSLGIGVNDEVIVPAHTFVATFNAISLVGAKPVPVDADLKTYNVDYETIEPKINKSTKAIVVVHMYGLSVDMSSINLIAQKYNLFVIEDYAQAHGATFCNRNVGTFGNINATSFYPTKNLGALGDGGAISTNDVNLYEKSLLLRNYGSKEKYKNEIIGLNSRLDELQAGFLNVKLQYLKDWINQKNELVNVYINLLSDLEEIKFSDYNKDMYFHSYHLLVVLVTNRFQLVEFLKSRGIQTQIHYPVPPHLQECYKFLGYNKGDFKNAEYISNNALSLPLFVGLNVPQIEFVCKTIKEFYTMK